MKNTTITFVLIVNLFISINGYAAVTSVGEINVVGQTEGVVPASTTAPLIVTLVIDRSLAEPGEEIKTIEILMPPGFLTQPSAFKGISRDRNPLVARAIVSGGDVLRVELANTIVDLQNSIYEITFDCQTPNTTTLSAAFRVRLRNLDDAPIGEFIRGGQADGKLNNDKFTLQVIANVPPAPVIGFTAEADTTGENDVTLRWQNSADPDVNGYLIYRHKEESPINVKGRSSTTFRDVNVPPGEHTYQITAYKTRLLQSERSPIQTVNVSPDTAPPEPPMTLSIITSNQGVEVSWKPSVSRDVTRYEVWFGSSGTEPKPLPDGSLQRTAEDETTGYRFIDERILSVGSFTYAVIAVDEADNASAPTQAKLRIFAKPYPNPFTPLSPDKDFNQVVFPARAIEDASGEFTVLIYDIDGMLVKTLTALPGETELTWDGRDETGEILESGVYVYQLQVGENFKTGTVILAK